jgi:hypothetical protein
MPRATAVAPAPELPASPVRLRHVLLLGALGLAGTWLYPRAHAAWKLNGLAVALADYGACMAGPTGAALLRARQLDEFQKLVRRRLVTAPAGETPFKRCAELAQKLTGSAAAEQAHRASAYSFAEYGGNASPAHTLAELAVSPDAVAKEAHRAWPIIRGYSTLVKPSLGAFEALHPVAPSDPARGRGLPSGRAYYRTVRVERDGALLAFGSGANAGVYRTTDGGLSFVPVPKGLGVGFAERCPTGPDGRGFVLQGDGDGTLVVSLVPGAEARATRLARDPDEIAALACDERVLVAAVRAQGSRRSALRRCALLGSCEPMPEPSLGVPAVGLDFPLDLARVGGVTVMALGMGNVVRVVSARDGAGWTPTSVAYDGDAYGLPVAKRPTRLLTLGKRVLLHGAAARANETYPLLYSDDQGASFRGR